MKEYNWDLVGDDWCQGCIFENRPVLCSRDWETCKEDLKKLVHDLETNRSWFTNKGEKDGS